MWRPAFCMLAQNENVGTPPNFWDMVEGCLSIGFCFRAGRKWCFPFFRWLSRKSGGDLLITKRQGTFRRLSQDKLRNIIKNTHSLRNSQLGKPFPKDKCMPKRHRQIFGIWLKAANQFVLVWTGSTWCFPSFWWLSQKSGGHLIIIKRQVLRLVKVQNNISRMNCWLGIIFNWWLFLNEWLIKK